jgi:hypothetical protein
MMVLTDTVQDLTLAPVVELATQVVEADGSPVRDAWVSSGGDSAAPFELFPGSEVAAGSKPFSGESDSLGFARHSRFPTAKIWEIRARFQPPGGFQRTTYINDVAVLHDTTITLVLPPPPTTTAMFSGTLRNGQGGPADGATVRFDALGYSTSGLTDELGQFQFEAPTGSGTLHVMGVNYTFNPPGMAAPWWLRSPMSLFGNTNVTLTLPPTIKLTLRVTHADGTLISGASFTARADSIVPFELFPGSQVVGGSLPVGAMMDTLHLGFVRVTLFPEAWIEEITATHEGFSSSIHGIRALTDTTLTLVLDDATTGIVPDAPVLRLALEGVRPNPVINGALKVHLELPDDSPAFLALYDVTGRQLDARHVGWLGPGKHVVELMPGGTLRPGVYWLWLTQSARAVTAKAAVVR